jgi:hypothetical protein
VLLALIRKGSCLLLSADLLCENWMKKYIHVDKYFEYSLVVRVALLVGHP